MSHRLLRAALAVGLITLLLAGAAAAAEPEFRGMWVTRFEWPNKDLDACKHNIDTILTNLQQANFNAVIFQMRGQCDTLYPSPEEPWSPILSADGTTPAGWGDFDPMAYAIEAAHSRGLEFHAYINTHVAWQSSAQPGRDVIVDNTDPGFTVLSGAWDTATASKAYGADYRKTATSPTQTSEVEWRPTIPVSDYYQVYAWYPSASGGGKVTYTIDFPDDPAPTLALYESVAIDQTAATGMWKTVGGLHYFKAGTNGRVRLSNAWNRSGSAFADAVLFRPVSPAAPNHPFYQHCKFDDPEHRDWLLADMTGRPVQYGESNYVWMSPGVPDWAAYTRRQIMYVVKNYNVDGVHFDRIRTPSNPNWTDWSHDPITEGRFANPESNPDGLGWSDWMREQTNRFVRDIYAEIQEVKPNVKVSSSPLGLYAYDRYPPIFSTKAYYGPPCGYQYEYSCVYQAAQNWLATGGMDFIVPQIYWGDPPVRAATNNPHFSEVLPDWIAHRADRHLVAGHSLSNVSYNIGEIHNEIGITRASGGQGNVVFSYTALAPGDWAAYASGVYAEPTTLPDMPWKSSPTQGVIIGTVTEADGVTPIMDSQVTRTPGADPPYTALSSGDGLYSMLLVDPGTYTLTIRKTGYSDCEKTGVTVTAGAVTRVNVSLGLPSPTTSDPDPALGVCPGDPVEFTITATDALSYQWYRDAAVPLADEGHYSGVTTATLTISDVSSADVGSYYCVVTGACASATSAAAALTLSLDSDADGHVDCLDSCPQSVLSASIVVAGCDTGVRNQMLDDGCTMADEIARAAGQARNHGGFVSAVADLTNGWKNQGLISGAEKGKVESCAAKSAIPGSADTKLGARNQGLDETAAASDSIAAVTQVPACGAGFVEPGLLAMASLALWGGLCRRSRY